MSRVLGGLYSQLESIVFEEHAQLKCNSLHQRNYSVTTKDRSHVTYRNPNPYTEVVRTFVCTYQFWVPHLESLQNTATYLCDLIYTDIGEIEKWLASFLSLGFVLCRWLRHGAPLGVSNRHRHDLWVFVYNMWSC